MYKADLLFETQQVQSAEEEEGQLRVYGCVCARVNDLGEFVDGFRFEQEGIYVNRVCRWTDWSNRFGGRGGGGARHVQGRKG